MPEMLERWLNTGVDTYKFSWETEDKKHMVFKALQGVRCKIIEVYINKKKRNYKFYFYIQPDLTKDNAKMLHSIVVPFDKSVTTHLTDGLEKLAKA